ncbi:unnamed protein product [Plutella xylostella]|uniref:(diamondback moth) hypothetical protein n=1 Tax=Plutella xylostella TaxID=51655 RepID=A0A8S4D9I0_PLUXY|nr:unnamed protein product [Plutella xylostella]
MEVVTISKDNNKIFTTLNYSHSVKPHYELLQWLLLPVARRPVLRAGGGLRLPGPLLRPVLRACLLRPLRAPVRHLQLPVSQLLLNVRQRGDDAGCSTVV